MKKILITTGVFPPDIGGPASYSLMLVKKLSQVFHLTLITYSSVRSHDLDKDSSFKVIRIWKKIPRFLRHFIFFIKTFSEAKKANVIFSMNAVSAGVPALVVSKILKKKFFIKIVGDYAWEIAVNKGKTILLLDDFQGSKKNGWIWLLHRLQTWVCKNAEKIIVPSEYLAKIVKGWGIEEEKIKVIYNGVDFKPAKISKEDTRKKIGISGNIILSIGRLVPWKGFRMLIKIMLPLLKINHFFRLVIVGDGPDNQKLNSMIKNLGLKRQVYLAGRKTQDQLVDYMAAADIFILNSGYEGFSHQILEAMQAGVPLITTAVGGNQEIIHQGENGFMVRYNDEFNLLETIKLVWQNQKIRERLIENGKKTAEYFSIDRMIKETIKVLKSE